MPRRLALLLVLAVLGLAPIAPTAAEPGPADPLAAGAVRAGAARVDSTWHVGASAGQYAGKGPGFRDAHGDGVDPSLHSTTQEPSYGIQGREWVRALVVEGAGGTRWALVSNDLYIPQDLVNRRVAGILADRDRRIDLGLATGRKTGITPENLTVSVSHSHSSPYYSAAAWGLWLFQDVFDIRYFEHIAQRMAEAVVQASNTMVPVRMGAAEVPLTQLTRHSYGPTISAERPALPAGYRNDDTLRSLAVVRFDDISDAGNPKPLANWVVYGRHPESLDGNDLLASEWPNELQTIVDREVGGITLFSQRDTGTAENARNGEAHAPQERQEFDHREYNQLTRLARTAADAAIRAHRAVAGEDVPGATVVPFRDRFAVGVTDLRFAPPGYRPLSTVSNCRTEDTVEGNPGVPVAGLPDCQRTADVTPAGLPFDPGVTYRQLRDAGVPIPDSYSAPQYAAVQETLQVHLQAIRLGSVGVTICPCEQFADQVRNISTRLDRTPGNVWYGWDWTANPKMHPGWKAGVIYDGKNLPGHGPLTLPDANGEHFCTQNADTTWTCVDPRWKASEFRPPRDAGQTRFLPPVPDSAFRRMKAQIYNDAKGWDAPENAVASETEPADVAKIWGNYTHEEYDGQMAGGGYDLVLGVSMTNDYWGYIVPYREFQCCDAYRKALTALGPHSSDFLATRLARMAASLKGAPAVQLSPKDLAYAPEYAHQGARAEAIGRAAQALLPAYEAQIPSDGGAPAITAQPKDTERFGIATVRWVGGSNYVDTPAPVVQRCVADGCDPADAAAWEDFADGYASGVQVKVDYPTPAEVPLWRAGQYAWEWTATFEARSSDIPVPDLQGVPRTQTPEGTYRFVVRGCRKDATPATAGAGQGCRSYDPSGRVRSYQLVSQPFRVAPWRGITVEDLRVEPDGRVSFAVGPRYPYPVSASNTELGDIDYPDSYTSPFPHIKVEPANDLRTYLPGPEDDERFCFHCTFAPWADTGAVASATVEVRRAGAMRSVPAERDPATGRFRTTVPLAPGDLVRVPSGAVLDTFGETNGSPSAEVLVGPRV